MFLRMYTICKWGQDFDRLFIPSEVMLVLGSLKALRSTLTKLTKESNLKRHLSDTW